MAAEPYWSGLDWKALAAVAGVIGTLASPFLVAWWNGRTKELETSARSAETAAERMERQQRDAFERLERERDHYQQRARTAEAAETLAEVRADHERANGRAMDDWAHWMRHGWVNRNASFRALAKVLEGLIAGTVAPEWAAAIVTEYQNNPLDDPPFVPLLRDASNVKPPEGV